MKKPAIVFIITKLELGGAQKVCLALYRGAQKNGHPAYLISGNEGPLVHQVENDPNVFLLPALKREVGLATVVAELKAARSIMQFLKKLKKQHPDLIVHTHSTKAGIIGRWAAWCAGIRTRIHTIHGFAFHQFQRWPYWLAIYLCELITSTITTRFICVSSYDQKTGLRLFPFFKHKHCIIRAAVDHSQFVPAHALDIKPKPFIFGTVACFKPQKNIFDLLKAFNVVHQAAPHTKLEIIGDGILRNSIEQWIADHNLKHSITVHGWQNNVASYMRQWHAFTLSSLWEGLPCSVIEARYMKLPVICYQVGGIHDVIQNNCNGHLIEPNNWQQLAEHMLKVATDQSLYMHYCMYPDNNLHDFTYDAMIKNHCNQYQQLH